ncbi:RNA 2',3'-cyclic phosphodiesterase [Acidihalobacter prosperus]
MRVFFALLPDPVAREQLSTLMRSLPTSAGRRVRYDNLHLTLAFIGEVGETEVDRLRACARQTKMMPINIRLERLGGNGRSRVCWIAPCRGYDIEVSELASRLRSVLISCGFECEHATFQPHVTLSRSARVIPSECSVEPIEWEAREFALMLSRRKPDGVCYEILELYPSNPSAPLSTTPSVG